jgi:hypothetical protein
MSTLGLLFAQVGIGDLFQSGTALANLGVLGLFGLAVVILGWLHYKSDVREQKRGDAAAELATTLSAQFDRALDLIERMQSRRRNGDAR